MIGALASGRIGTFRSVPNRESPCVDDAADGVGLASLMHRALRAQHTSKVSSRTIQAAAVASTGAWAKARIIESYERKSSVQRKPARKRSHRPEVCRDREVFEATKTW